MIFSTATVAVNSEGETCLTRAQAWAGLALKAHDAREFLPPDVCTRCCVVEESVTHLVREATIGGVDLREIVTFEAQRKVTFFQATGPREGVIVNELLEDEQGALLLRFYCYLGMRDKVSVVSRGRTEQTHPNTPDQGYKVALLTTLQRTRELLAQGRI